MLDCYLEQDQCRPECGRCHEKDQTIDNANDFLDEIVKQLYTPQSLDMQNLCHCIEELCHILDLKMPKSNIQIAQTDPKAWVDDQLPYIKTWIELNNRYLAKTI